MGTCGLLTRRRASSSKQCAARRPLRWPWLRALQALALAAGLLGVPVVAVAQTLMMGEAPKVDGLNGLVSGVSTADDVLAALGRPRGTGAMRHSPGQPLRTVWFYELVMVKGDQVHLNILLVYLDGNRYDGHLWFSANELVKLSRRTP